MILRRSGVEEAARVVIAADRDDTAALVTLSVRRLNTDTTIAARNRCFAPAECEDMVLAVVRDGELKRYDEIMAFAEYDRLIQVQSRS
jgi:hypothetical protein